MKKVLFSLALIATFVIPVNAMQMQSWLGIEKKIEPSLVRLHTLANDGAGFCGGVIVELHKVLTANHCVKGTSLIAANGKAAIVERVDDDLDLALLDVKELEGPPLLLRIAPITPAVELVMVGYPLDDIYPTYTFGKVAKPVSTKVDIKNLTLFDIRIMEGDSGGPICDVNGRLVSIAQVGVEIGIGILAGGPKLELLRSFLEAK